jgi:hypothetical protein
MMMRKIRVIHQVFRGLCLALRCNIVPCLWRSVYSVAVTWTEKMPTGYC